MPAEVSTIFIGGEWGAAQSKGSLEVRSPSDGEVFASISRGGKPEVDRAVAAARDALAGPWSTMAGFERGRIMSRLSALILDNLEELAQLEARDTGKPITQARTDIRATARYFEFYAGAADKILGDVLPFLDGFQVTVQREPRGVCGLIIPWNYPASMFGRTIGPALATGNTVVLKPAEDASMSCMRLTALAHEAGLPSGVINLVTGLGEEAGAALSQHSDIDFLSFTGSPEVGTLIQTAAAKNHVPCVLELGGKSPQIVFDDADFENAAKTIVGVITQNAGQTCSAGSRVLIQRSAYDRFVAMLKEKMSEVRVGAPAADLPCGPVINGTQQTKVKGFIDRARADGIGVIAQGSLDTSAVETGYFVTPTLFGPVPVTHELAQEEVFGPVLAAIPFEDEADAIAIANGTAYGLVAGLWTENGARQMRVAKKLRVGQVFINNYGAGGGIELPFGGVKRSGHGREKGLEALKEYTVAKTVVLKHG
ncbi:MULTISPECIES: aldehyde dehydrogenase family protein [unclassified Caballeronia]|uniref:aldehyde dehydrogenase family protein n=1 Tax=unclassified Caballeronia TaxID=2646786 RepID=UPI00285EF174|nr:MULTISPECIES: aldehyde dehydrogenase family protein [unclassified Caballeronia]MDR5741139.1 aldehyde dehydrogenase family protein [Caballeronia sp. LZ016]MDR5807039.1 aldehyde dehydrogenase family protein [Caballeronia sp. LZ019]